MNCDEKLSKMLLVNKPIDWTSFDVVKKIRGMLKEKYNIKKIKVGHAGTLDPKASGLLIVCTGQKTKTIKLFEGLNKTYVGVMKLGFVTDSFDSETNEREPKSFQHISLDQIKAVFSQFLGLQKQKPPMFSAVKINGERLYKKARRGELDLELASRNIYIKELTAIELMLPFLKFEVNCSKGTYIRSLVSDIGKSLGCGAYLYSLNRTKIGAYNLKKAINIEDIYQSL
ncbi:MAG: tRNA pseudouridine(55) synthase TruB [Flavobacteriales bacterium]|nr:tRNA pseudouridine(55) synthase TruB [Flavobacteriales bacterium]|tara:strand:+ start:1622 stop:2305 length:684 start_codon:yes stop_codon:yes gene_type:complete